MRTKMIVLSIVGCIISICLILIYMTLPKEEDGTHSIRLRSEPKDGFTLEEMIQREKGQNVNGQGELPLLPNIVPEDSHPDLDHLQELIRENEEAFEEPSKLVLPHREDTIKLQTEQRTTPSEQAEEPAPVKKRRGFNSISLVKEDKANSIRAFVHSTQTVMVGSTLKMQLGENCLTDDGHRVNRGTPVYGEVTKIDGERVIIEIRQIQINDNILPFKKKVYSRDAIEGIYVPGNPKAEIANDANAAAVSGTNTNIEGGIGIGSQLVAGATNSVINATKAATTKNIKKIKVTIKTNYQLLLMEDTKK